MRNLRLFARLLPLLTGLAAMLSLGAPVAEAKAGVGTRDTTAKSASGALAEGTKRNAGKATSAADAEMNAKLERLGPLLGEIGVEAALAAGGKTDGLFVYAEMKGKQATLFVFRDRGKTVKRFEETPRLRELVEQAWAIEPVGKRWTAMTFEVQGKAFDARLLYPEEIDFRRPIDERVNALMPKRFEGKKLVADRKRPDAKEPGAFEPEIDGLWDADLGDGWRWT